MDAIFIMYIDCTRLGHIISVNIWYLLNLYINMLSNWTFWESIDKSYIWKTRMLAGSHTQAYIDALMCVYRFVYVLTRVYARLFVCVCIYSICVHLLFVNKIHVCVCVHLYYINNRCVCRSMYMQIDVPMHLHIQKYKNIYTCLRACMDAQEFKMTCVCKSAQEFK